MSRAVGHFLREWRKARGLTLEKVAAEIGTTHASLGRVERGLQPYNQYLLEKLEPVYGAKAHDLIATDPSSPEGQAIVAMDDLGPEEAKKVAEFASFLKASRQ